MTHRTQLGINSRCFGICNNYNKLLLRYKYTSYPYPWYHKIRVLFSCVKQFRPQSLNNSVHILKVTYKCDQPVQSSLNSLCTGKNSFSIAARRLRNFKKMPPECALYIVFLQKK